MELICAKSQLVTVSDTTHTIFLNIHTVVMGSVLTIFVFGALVSLQLQSLPKGERSVLTAEFTVLPV